MDFLSAGAGVGVVDCCCAEKSLGVELDNNNTKIMCAVVHYFLKVFLSTSISYMYIVFLIHLILVKTNTLRICSVISPF